MIATIDHEKFYPHRTHTITTFCVLGGWVEVKCATCNEVLSTTQRPPLEQAVMVLMQRQGITEYRSRGLHIQMTDDGVQVREERDQYYYKNRQIYDDPSTRYIVDSLGLSIGDKVTADDEIELPDGSTADPDRVGKFIAVHKGLVVIDYDGVEVELDPHAVELALADDYPDITEATDGT